MTKFKKKVDVLLIFPPGWSANAPYLSIPLLSEYLNLNGIYTKSIDLNIEIINYILTDRCISESARRIECILNNEIEIDKDKRQELLLALVLYRKYQGKFDKTIYKLKTENVLPKEHVEIYRLVDIAFRIYSAPFFPGRIHDGALVHTHKFIDHSQLVPEDYQIVRSISDLEMIFNNKKQDPYRPLVKQYVYSLNLQDYNLIGFSVCGFTQLISVASISYYIKKRSNVKIVVGGAIVPYLIEAIKCNTFLFKYIDYIVNGEGEIPLTEICKSINRPDEIKHIGGLIYCKNGIVYENPNKKFVEIDEIPTPNFDGFNLSKYLVPQKFMSLPIFASKGCYWNKCIFCGVNCNYSKFRLKNSDLVIKDMLVLNKRYGVTIFRFVDNCMHPNTIVDISNKLIETRKTFFWQCMARFESSFNKKIWETAQKSGLRIVSFGLESNSQFILDSMNKGVAVGDIPQILNDARNSNIFIHCFFIVGFPGEEKINTLELINFIYLNRYNIDSLTFTQFRLERKSLIFESINKYNLEVEKEYPNDYINPNIEYKDFCNIARRLMMIRYHVANLECSEFCFNDLSDVYILGLNAHSLRDELRKWQIIKVKALKEVYRNIRNGSIELDINFDINFDANRKDYPYIVFNNKLANYYLLCDNELNFDYSENRHNTHIENIKINTNLSQVKIYLDILTTKFV